MSERGRHWPLFLFALAWTAASLWVGAPVLHSALRELQSLTFVPVEASVVSIGHRAVDGEPRYVLEYRYRRDEREFTGLRRFPTPGPLPREESVEELEQRYTRGSSFTAYVNPFDPADAVARRGFRASTLYPLFWIVPALIAALGAWIFAWRTFRGPREGELCEDARVTYGMGGDWRLRVMRLVAWGQGAVALAMAALGAGFVLVPESGRPYFSHTVAAWVLILAIAGFVYALIAWKVRSGGYDWRWSARRQELRVPSGKWLRKSDFERLGVARVGRKDTEGDPVYDAIVQLHPRAGPPLDVITGSSDKGFEEAFEEVRPVALFLGERLGLVCEAQP